MYWKIEYNKYSMRLDITEVSSAKVWFSSYIFKNTILFRVNCKTKEVESICEGYRKRYEFDGQGKKASITYFFELSEYQNIYKLLQDINKDILKEHSLDIEQIRTVLMNMLNMHKNIGLLEKAKWFNNCKIEDSDLALSLYLKFKDKQEKI